MEGVVSFEKEEERRKTTLSVTQLSVKPSKQYPFSKKGATAITFGICTTSFPRS